MNRRHGGGSRIIRGYRRNFAGHVVLVALPPSQSISFLYPPCDIVKLDFQKDFQAVDKLWITSDTPLPLTPPHPNPLLDRILSGKLGLIRDRHHHIKRDFGLSTNLSSQGSLYPLAFLGVPFYVRYTARTRQFSSEPSYTWSTIIAYLKSLLIAKSHSLSS